MDLADGLCWTSQDHPGRSEAQADVADETVDALAGRLGITRSLCEDERALKDRLGVPSETFGRPGALRPARLHRGRGIVDLLRHGADEAGVLVCLAADDQ